MRRTDSNFDEGILANTKKWYEEYPKAQTPSQHGKSDSEVIDLKSEAKKCLDSESAAYHLKQTKSRDSEYSWLKTALSKGTTADKVAAGIVLVQNSPRHNLNHLTMLISQVKVAKHNQCSMIITSLRDLFLSDLLHPHCKLLKFEEQDLNQLDQYNKSFEADEEANLKRPTLSKNKLLASWYFEDQLKEIYERFVNSLSAIANDTVDTNREKAVAVMNDLLKGNPEQEQKLLDLLVNKIGDPSSKVAAKAIFCLSNLLHEHPLMKEIVLNEVEKLLFRPNIAPRAQYFAICLLTQFVLTKEDTAVATTLIDVYFAFFKACLKKGEPDSRMMAAILAGVNRAYRFSDLDSIKLTDHINSVYKVVHLGSFNVSLNALSLLFQVVGKDPVKSDRFYSAFYRKLLDPQIATASKRAVFLNLLYRVLKTDESILRTHAYVKRLLQVCLYYPANMVCAILYILSQILLTKKSKKRLLTKSTAIVKDEIDLSETVDESKETQETTKVEEKKAENNIVLSNVVLIPEEPTEEKKEEDIKPENVKVKVEFEVTHYDPTTRNPLRSGAHLSLCSELVALTKHFHPSVSLFANSLLQGKPIEYTGDPLEDLNLIRFLDRYVFKNPKKLESKKVVKKNDPLAWRKGYAPKGIRTLPVDSAAYLNEREDRIPVDELFLYQYLNKRKETGGFKNKDENEEDDIESVNSEDFNDMLDKLSKTKDVDELDIASDFRAVPKKSKSKEDSDDDIGDEEEGEEDDLDEEVSDDGDDDEEEDFDDGDFDGELEDLDDLDLDEIDDDLSDMEFSEGDEVDTKSTKKRKENKMSGNPNKKLKKDDKTFVSAEEFAEMLESQGRANFKHGASRSFSDRDGASVKQLDWETARNQRISGFRGGQKRKNSFKTNKSKKSFSSHQKPIKRKKK